MVLLTFILAIKTIFIDKNWDFIAYFIKVRN